MKYDIYIYYYLDRYNYNIILIKNNLNLLK